MSIPGDQQANREALSALMDGEAQALELRRVLQQTDENGELSAMWHRMHIVRAGLRGELAHTSFTADIAAQVRAAIENEEQASTNSPWRLLATRTAVAASVAVAVLVGSQWVLKDNAASTQATMAQVPNAAPAVAAASTLVDTSTGVDPLRVASGSNQRAATIMSVPVNMLPPEASRVRINNYMLYHAQHAAQNDSRGIVPMSNATYFHQQ